MHFLNRAIVGLWSALAPAIAWAQPTTLIPESGTIGSCNFKTGEFTFECIPMYIGYLVQWAFAGVGMFCLIQCIWAGYEIAIANAIGKDKSEGVRRLTNAITGLVVCVLSFAIIDFVLSAVTGE